MWHRTQRRLFPPRVHPARWNTSLPDLALLRTLIPLPADPTPILTTAADACAGCFTLLGFPTFNLGSPPNWHTDPHSGHHWNSTAPARVLDLMTRDSPADARVVWELNRFHHAVALGTAWRVTRDGCYPATFVSQVGDWLAANPVGHGINWACAMEVAVRAINWLFACALMQEALPAEFERALLGALLTHGHYIRANLELALVTTNHYLADLCGLAVLGLALPGAEPDRWRRFALRELAREVAFQVYPDGADFEASTSYHRLAVELFDLPARLAQHTGALVPPILTEQLPLMRAFTAAVTRPDGALPLIGDSDDGHLLPSLSALPSSTSTSTPFPHAGIYVMRHADRYLICDCGPNGQRGNGGHAHNDTLSFELYAGRPWIVDPGTYTYTGDLDAYNWFRSTAAHNTLVVDGEEQARFDPHEPFLLAPDAQPTVRRWESTPDYDLLDAEHTGYHRLPDPVTHRRHILFDKQSGLWLVRDIVTGGGRHRLDWYFHFAPLSVTTNETKPSAVRATASDGASLLLVLLECSAMSFSASRHAPAGLPNPAASGGFGNPPRAGCELLHLTIEEGWVSYRYGSRERAPVARYTARKVTLPVTVTFALIPTSEPLPIAEATESIEQSLAVLEAQS